MSSLYRGPPKDGSYRISIHLAKQFQRRRFLSRPIRNKNCLWRPCLLMDRDKMTNLCRGPSIDASYQVLLHLAEGVSEEKIKMWKVNARQMKDAKWWQKLTLPLARRANKRNSWMSQWHPWYHVCLHPTSKHHHHIEYSYIIHVLAEA